MAEPKRHHYVTQSYLEQWEVPPETPGKNQRPTFWVYDKEDATLTPRGATGKNTAVIGHYYTVEGADGEPSTELEGIFGVLEDSMTARIHQLEDEGRQLTQEDHAFLVELTAISSARVPRRIKTIEAIGSVLAEEMISVLARDPAVQEAFLRENPQYPPEILEELSTEASHRGFIAKLGPSKALALALDHAQDILRDLLSKDWRLIRARDGQDFLTSDAPVAFYLQVGTRYGIFGHDCSNPQTEVWYPLSPRVGVHFGPLPRHGLTTEDLVTDLNKRTVFHAERWVISRRQDPVIVQWLKEAAKRPSGFNIEGYRNTLRAQLEKVKDLTQLHKAAKLPPIRRQGPCPCGSGKKAKRCCFS